MQNWKKDIERQIEENRVRKQEEQQRDRNEEQSRLMIDAYYNDQYPVHKNQYYMGKLQPCTKCHTVYPQKKL